MQTINCQDYPIHIGSIEQSLANFLQGRDYSSVAVVVDENTRRHCLPLILDVLDSKHLTIVEVSAGELFKNIETCTLIWKKLLMAGFDRNSLVVNLGGGVIGDMGGFCASSYMRGIDFLQIPTTLLAQVDASVGGKLGVDLEMVKNIVGFFNNPKAVLVDPKFLKTLNSREVLSGYAEVVKHALIADSVMWNKSILLVLDPHKINSDQLSRSIQVKRNIVEQDPFEKGLRKILNFGHTVGHAVETVSWETKNPLLHGEAIFVGMICETYLAYAKNLISMDLCDAVCRVLKGIFYRKDAVSSTEEIFQIMLKDKKNRRQEIRAALINGIGSAKYDVILTREEVSESFQYYKKL